MNKSRYMEVKKIYDTEQLDLFEDIFNRIRSYRCLWCHGCLYAPDPTRNDMKAAKEFFAAHDRYLKNLKVHKTVFETEIAKIIDQYRLAVVIPLRLGWLEVNDKPHCQGNSACKICHLEITMEN